MSHSKSSENLPLSCLDPLLHCKIHTIQFSFTKHIFHIATKEKHWPRENKMLHAKRR